MTLSPCLSGNNSPSRDAENRKNYADIPSREATNPSRSGTKRRLQDRHLDMASQSSHPRLDIGIIKSEADTGSQRGQTTFVDYSGLKFSESSETPGYIKPEEEIPDTSQFLGSHGVTSGDCFCWSSDARMNLLVVRCSIEAKSEGGSQSKEHSCESRAQ